VLGEKKPQKSFFDMAAEQRVSNHFLLKIDRLIDWKPLQKELSKLYHPSLGRPSYPPLVMFKALLLQQWYNLSDRQLEESIRDRISFLRFLGLSIEGPVPDETTICRFRAKLCEVGLAEKLFRLISDQLEQKGLLLKKGSIIDATLIEAARRPPAKGSPARDPDAAYTVRGKKPFYGYKAHVTLDHKSEFIREVKVTPANVHDSCMFDEMIQGDEEAVFADKGYWRESRKHTLRVFGIYCGIMDRAKRNASLSRRQRKRNRRLSRVRARIEKVFGTLKRIYGMVRVRYVGLLKNRGHFYILAAALNLKRMVKLCEAGA